MCGKYTDPNHPTIPMEEADVCFDTAKWVYELDECAREFRLKEIAMHLIDAVSSKQKRKRE